MIENRLQADGQRGKDADDAGGAEQRRRSGRCQVASSTNMTSVMKVVK
jgi:hypothetical protein